MTVTRPRSYVQGLRYDALDHARSSSSGEGKKEREKEGKRKKNRDAESDEETLSSVDALSSRLSSVARCRRPRGCYLRTQSILEFRRRDNSNDREATAEETTRRQRRRRDDGNWSYSRWRPASPVLRTRNGPAGPSAVRSARGVRHGRKRRNKLLAKPIRQRNGATGLVL